MLTHIHIDNFTIVKQLSLDFASGLNILTGETGAGKSIWIDAIGYALGNRIDAQIIFPEANQCVITVCFDVTNLPGAQQWLEQNDLSSDNECIIRRTINLNGQNKLTINGQPCALQMVKELRRHLLSIHGQHQHQLLLKPEVQQQLFDSYGQHQTLVNNIAVCYQQWHALYKQIHELELKAQNHESQSNLLRYQLEELIALNLQPDEWQQLTDEHRRLHNAQNILQHVNHAIDLTDEAEDQSALSLLHRAAQELKHIELNDSALNNAQSLLDNTIVYLQESLDELQRYRNQFNLDPDHLTQLELRLSTIHELARKHHVTAEELPAIQITLTQQLKELDDLDHTMQKLRERSNEILQRFKKLASKLTEARQTTAKTLQLKLTGYLHQLGITGGRFEIQFNPADKPISLHGNETITFAIATNPGQPLQPLQKIVSGGELSRVSLAIQVLLSEVEHTQTLIFDEVDVGIGGKIAEIVGRLLRQLGQHAQVLCITHLPQVAAQAMHHYKVIKQTHDDTVITQIKPLDKTERVEELARMLGGKTISKKTREHANEMLTVASET